MSRPLDMQGLYKYAPGRLGTPCLSEYVSTASRVQATMPQQQSSHPAVSIDETTKAVIYTAPDGTTYEAPKGTLIAHLMRSDVFELPGCEEDGSPTPLPSGVQTSEDPDITRQRFFYSKGSFTVDTDFREHFKTLFMTKVVATSREDSRLLFSVTLLVRQDWTEIEYEARKAELRGNPIHPLPPPPPPPPPR